MTDDLIKRLSRNCPHDEVGCICDEAEDALAAQAAEIERLQLFIATEAAAAAGRLKALRDPLPILDDVPVEWIKRMTEGLADQGDKLAAGITAALRKEGE